MKPVVTSLRGLAVKALLPVLLCVTLTAAAQDAPLIARVLKVRGAARYSTDGKNWQKVSSGDGLSAGCLIQTADKSTLDLELGTPGRHSKATIDDKLVAGKREASADLVRMYQETILAIDTLTSDQSGAVKKIGLDLRAGSIFGSVTRQNDDSSCEVRLPYGIAGTTGGTYLIRSTGKSRVMRGQLIVVIAGADGSMSTKLISADQEYNPATGQITDISPGSESAPAAEAPPTPAVSSTPAPQSPQPSAFPQPQYQYPKRSF